MKTLLMVGVVILIGCLPALAQIMESDEDMIAKRLICGYLDNGNLSGKQKYKYTNEIFNCLYKEDDIAKTGKCLDEMLKKEGLSEIAKDTSFIIKDSLLKIKETVDDRVTNQHMGTFELQHDGTAKTNVPLARFHLSGKSLRIPFYLYLSPEVKFIEEEDNEERKSKMLLSSTGGILSITAKKYYDLFAPCNDYHFRPLWLASAMFLNSLDSLNEKYKPDFRVLLGCGINFISEISEEYQGHLWIEVQATYSATSKDVYREVYGQEARPSFFGLTGTFNLKLINIINVKVQYLKAFDSRIESLDNGFGIVSIGTAVNM